MALNVVALVVGLLLIWITLRDVFQSALVPRAAFSHWRVSMIQTRWLWRLWPPAAARYRDPLQREAVLATFAPFNMVLLLVTWVVVTGLGYGLIFYALREQLRPADIDFVSALYFAGASMLTIGYGDIVAITPLARFVAVVAGATGLGIVTVVMSYLFQVVGAFGKRETFVVALSARAGTPPSGVGLLEVHGYAGAIDDLPNVLRDGQAWAAALTQTHVANPMLTYFRSNQGDQSWIATMAVLLDAASLVLSTVDGVPHAQASFMLTTGRRAIHDITANRHIPPSNVEVARHQFDAACARLTRSGYTIREPDTSWTEFCRLRRTYGAQLHALAHYFHIPPSMWIAGHNEP
ncbi:MAG TPA: potassium channel family protein [Candidatus Baltobacteraceae bacterium]